ncbi:MAG: hypothetical protein SVV03_04625 [Candidatus Nanohaloarchaea archaeon]|nr:hypothetical protein [Candidatus Nanohaloarchaea archaeon]
MEECSLNENTYVFIEEFTTINQGAAREDRVENTGSCKNGRILPRKILNCRKIKDILVFGPIPGD